MRTKIRRANRPLNRTQAEWNALKQALKKVTDLGTGELSFTELRTQVALPLPWSPAELTDGLLTQFCQEANLELV